MGTASETYFVFCLKQFDVYLLTHFWISMYLSGPGNLNSIVFQYGLPRNSWRARITDFSLVNCGLNDLGLLGELLRIR